MATVRRTTILMTATPESDHDWRERAIEILAEYALAGAAIERIPQGLVNLTLKLTTASGQRFVLQRLHPVFGVSVNDNIAQVTAHLARHGLLTPSLVRTLDGASCVVRERAIWRLLSFVDGCAFDRVAGPAQAQAAGGLLARFHRALADFDGRLVSERPPIHDFPRHRARLAAARAAHAGHRLVTAVTAIDDRIAACAAAYPPPAATSLRLVHGDPKISNMLFDADGTTALCMIDLDTLATLPLALELGDALRSWCNPTAEDAADARFDLNLFSAALSGYAAEARDFISADERAAIVPATLAIHLELATRFLIDALEENYFGWDAARYGSRGEHNLARARGQWRAAQSLIAQWPDLVQALAQVFA